MRSLLILALAVPCAAAPADDIVVGMSAALSGPSAALGRGVKLGIESYFALVNAEGGVGGR